MLGAGAVLGTSGTVAAGAATRAGLPDSPEYGDGRLSGELPAGNRAGPYGGDYDPPDELRSDALDALTIPPPPRRGMVEVDMTVIEQRHAISRSYAIDAWTYNGSAPGPILRATEGDTLRVRFRNATEHDHNLHFHGRHSPAQDGWEPVPPGGEVIYEIEAGPVGVHPYHCHTMPIDLHISRGLYGTLIVDPPDGRPDAHERVLVLSGWDLDGDHRNEVYSWNGVAGFFAKFPIKLPRREPVRLYLLNLAEYEPVVSFHLHAQVFDVYPAGAGEAPASTTDVVTLGPMDRAMLEFTLPDLGRYLFHPHQHAIAARGAMGWLAAID